MGLTSKELFEKRKCRVRSAIKSKATKTVRLSVFRSNRHVFAQLIDDARAVTLVQASTLDKELAEQFAGKPTIQAAEQVGKLLAQRANKLKVSDVYFDRGGYMYHGRVKALADAARQHGLKF